MVRCRWLVIPTSSILCIAVWATAVPAQQPSFALVCRGPLNTFRADAGKVIKTRFIWAKELASKANPGPGECAWTDRPPQAAEVKPGDEHTIVGNLGPFDDLPVGTFAKICVTATDNGLLVRDVIRGTGQNAPFQIPPFNAGGCPG
jgi:hypothetical protein